MDRRTLATYAALLALIGVLIAADYLLYGAGEHLRPGPTPLPLPGPAGPPSTPDDTPP